MPRPGPEGCQIRTDDKLVPPRPGIPGTRAPVHLPNQRYVSILALSIRRRRRSKVPVDPPRESGCWGSGGKVTKRSIDPIHPTFGSSARPPGVRRKWWSWPRQLSFTSRVSRSLRFCRGEPRLSRGSQRRRCALLRIWWSFSRKARF